MKSIFNGKVVTLSLSLLFLCTFFSAVEAGGDYRGWKHAIESKASYEELLEFCEQGKQGIRLKPKLAEEPIPGWMLSETKSRRITKWEKREEVLTTCSPDKGILTPEAYQKLSALKKKKAFEHHIEDHKRIYIQKAFEHIEKNFMYRLKQTHEKSSERCNVALNTLRASMEFLDKQNPFQNLQNSSELEKSILESSKEVYENLRVVDKTKAVLQQNDHIPMIAFTEFKKGFENIEPTKIPGDIDYWFERCQLQYYDSKNEKRIDLQPVYHAIKDELSAYINQERANYYKIEKK